MEQIKELTPINVHVKNDWLLNCTHVTAEFFGTVDEGQLDRASALIKNYFGIHVDTGQPGPATPERVIFNDPATIVLWSDGTKTVSKAAGCDEYEPMRGVMTCALRKVGRNRVRTEAWDDVIAYLADSVADADECRVLSDMLYAAADILETGSTMEGIIEWDAERAGADDGDADGLDDQPLPLGDGGE